MDMLERLLYRQGQHCKAGTREPHMLEICLEKINFCQNSEANDNFRNGRLADTKDGLHPSLSDGRTSAQEKGGL